MTRKKIIVNILHFKLNHHPFYIVYTSTATMMLKQTYLSETVEKGFWKAFSATTLIRRILTCKNSKRWGTLKGATQLWNKDFSSVIQNSIQTLTTIKIPPMIMFSLLNNKKIHKEKNKLQITLSNSSLSSISSFKLHFFQGLVTTYPHVV